MKKTIILIVAFLPIFAHAENMCVKNGSVMVVLDPVSTGTTLSYNNNSNLKWSTKFSYGIISGVAGCYNNVGTTEGGIASDQTNITPYSTGNYCYCKMLRPIESFWVYSGGNGTQSGFCTGCVGCCASYCANRIGTSRTLRNGLFGNVIE